MTDDPQPERPTSANLTVAVLGTGTMGAPMARNLLAAGHAVRVWNRNAERAAPLADDGATVWRSPAEAAAGATHLLTMLWDLESVVEVVRDALPALPAGAVWIQATTVGLEGSRALSALAAEHGVRYIDAPVLGTKAPAEQGTLVVLATGDDDVRLQVAPVLDAVGRRTIWVDGELGATKLKLVVNAWVLALIGAIAESVALATRVGVDPGLFLDAIKGGPTDTPYAQIKGAAMMARDFTPAFSLKGALKDAGLVLDAAREAGVEMAVTEAVRGQMSIAVADGHGDQDMAATYWAHAPRE